MSAYFERLDAGSFRATEHTSGAWSTTEQHVAPAMGLLAHLVDVDVRDRRGDDALVLGRATYDILGVMPVGAFATDVRVVRPGRTIELVEATLSTGGRAALVLRAWLLRPDDTGAVAGSPTPGMPGPDALEPWDPSSVWPGGFIAGIEVRRDEQAPGHARFWGRTPLPLLADEPVGTRAAYLGLLDIANGMTVRAAPTEVAFPNLDLTTHLHREPEPVDGWVGFDTRVTFGAGGVGLTTSTLHDARGPVGVSSQVLTVRPG